MRKVLLAYVPVLHTGYLNFFRKHADAQTLYVLDPKIIQFVDDDIFRKDIRRLPTTELVLALQSWQIFCHIAVAQIDTLADLSTAGVKIGRTASPLCV